MRGKSPAKGGTNGLSEARPQRGFRRHGWHGGGGLGAGIPLHSAPDLSHRAVRRLRHPDRQRHARLSHHAERARRRHRRRQALDRGVRDGLRYAEGRGVLRGHQGQGRARLQSLFDRHHAAAHPEGFGRQDPGSLHGLRAVRLGDRQGVSVGLQPARHLLGRRLRGHQGHCRARRRARQALRQEDRLHLPRCRLWSRADPPPRAARKKIRLTSFSNTQCRVRRCRTNPRSG